MITKRDLLRSAALAAIVATTAKSVPASAQTKAEWPNLIEAKAIAEEGFIYGLPVVMNYAVMYEFSVDTKNSQFKAPFNQIKNLAYVATYKDTAVVTPNSDTPYSTLWFDLRAEPMVVSVPAVEKTRYYTVQLIDGFHFKILPVSIFYLYGTEFCDALISNAYRGRQRGSQGDATAGEVSLQLHAERSCCKVELSERALSPPT